MILTNRVILFLIITIFTACGRHRETMVSTPHDDHLAIYKATVDRIVSLIDSGWVVSRYKDGRAKDQGDSLLFTGLAMGAMPCSQGAAQEAALLKMLDEKHGGVYRHPSIPDDYSLDGLLGLWWGINNRTKRCPDSKDIWAKILPQHAAAVAIEPFFYTVLDQVEANLGIAPEPTLSQRGDLGAAVGAWAMGVVSQRAAAYRLHLGYLALSIVKAPKGEAVFCEAVKDAKIALIEHFCGRSGLDAWIHNFAFNRYVYAFQRAAWEDADGREDVDTPGVDLLVALSIMYPDTVSQASKVNF